MVSCHVSRAAVASVFSGMWRVLPDLAVSPFTVSMARVKSMSVHWRVSSSPRRIPVLMANMTKGFRWSVYRPSRLGNAVFFLALSHWLWVSRSVRLRSSRWSRACNRLASSSLLKKRTFPAWSTLEGLSSARGWTGINCHSTALANAALIEVMSRLTVAGRMPVFSRLERHFSIIHALSSLNFLSPNSGIKQAFKRASVALPSLRWASTHGP